MKKIKQSIQSLNLDEGSILSRQELRSIAGGNDILCLTDGECVDYGLLYCDENTHRCVGEGSRCRSGRSCIVAISGHGNQPGICEENSSSQCVCRALDVSGSAVSQDCVA